jgi:hypothetical protein
MSIETGLEIANDVAHTADEEPEAAEAADSEPGEADAPESDAGEPDAQAEAPKPEDATEDLSVTFEGVKPPEEDRTPAPAWVRDVRKQNRELLKQNRELQRRLNESTAERPPAALPKKPTLEEHDYDAAKFEAALLSWTEQKRQHDEAEARRKAEAEKQAADYQAKLAAYGSADVRRQVADFEDAEAVVLAAFDVTQQGIILQGAENPALLVYALGKNEAKAKELAAIKDPVRFAFALAKLEATMRVNRRAAPAPERPVAGSVKPGASAGNAHLERLRAEADRTGDRTKVAAYLRQQREKGR